MRAIGSGQLVMIERTRFPYGGCVGMTLGSRDGLETSGADRTWFVVLTQHSFTTAPARSRLAVRKVSMKRFVPVLEMYLEPVE